jgi:hypothetical protein
MIFNSVETAKVEQTAAVSSASTADMKRHMPNANKPRSNTSKTKPKNFGSSYIEADKLFNDARKNATEIH